MSVVVAVQEPKLTHQPSDWPNIHELVTEDGKPVDNIFSEKQMRLLTEPLYSNWSGPEGDPNYLVAANVGLFFTSRESPLVPDVLLSTRIGKLPYEITDKEHSSYFVWLIGKSPDLVIEIVSNKSGGEDTTKPPIYARWGVTYYVIYDPNLLLSEERLRVMVLSEGIYKRKPDNGWFAPIGLGLTMWHGVYEQQESIWLRWTDRKGEVIPTGAEKAAQETQRANLAEQDKLKAEQDKLKAEQDKLKAEQDKLKAEQDKLKAEQDKLKAEQDKAEAEARADAERLRNEQLLALLKEKGIDVNAL